RHTRLVSDWSSDVCSSDLEAVLPDGRGLLITGDARNGQACARCIGIGCFALVNTGAGLASSRNRLLGTIAYSQNGKRTYALEGRSEERRVGEEWRYRGPRG